MQTELSIKVEDGVSAYGRLHGSPEKPLVIIVHGIPGSINDGLHEHAASWFSKNGFAAFRFNLYGWQADARQLKDCTLKTHAADLDAIVKYFREQGAKSIFVAGHSFGGVTTLLSQTQEFDKAVLWDPSFDISFTKEKYDCPGGTYVKELDGYLMRWGANVVVGKAMADEVDNLDWSSLATDFHKPLRIIAAEKGVLVPGAKKYFAAANGPKDWSMITGATHSFDDSDEIREQLFVLTKEWFERETS